MPHQQSVNLYPIFKTVDMNETSGLLSLCNMHLGPTMTRSNIPYPEPVYTGWPSVHCNATGMPLADPVYTGIPPGDPANTCRVHWNTTGKT